MAERTLIEIVHAACGELGVPQPVAIVGSTDAQSVQMLALMNREGKELAAREGAAGGWPRLNKEHPITLIANRDFYDFPADLQYFLNTTAWDRTQKWPLKGPISPQAWQILKSGTIGSIGPRRRFRLMRGLLYLDPVPSVSEAGQQLVIEYQSDGWCESSAGVAQNRWITDGDRPTLPDEGFVLGLMWRFLRANRMDYAEEKDTYDKWVERTLARATGAPILALDGPNDFNRLIDSDNIPDSGYGGV